jgi:membrane protease YdiL (CAAX protease family)
MLSQKPWKTEAMLLFGLWLLLSMLVGFVTGSLLLRATQGNVLPIVVTALSFHGAALLLLPLFLREHGIGWSDAFGFNSPRPAVAVLIAIPATLAALPVARSLGQLSARAMTWLRLEPVAQTTVTTLQQSTDVAPQLILAVMAVGVAPVAEELLFRGILYPFAKQRMRPALALWGTSILFGAVHFNLMTLLPLTFLALMLTWLYELTGNLLAPIVAHGLFNLANFFWLVVDRSAG